MIICCEKKAARKNKMDENIVKYKLHELKKIASTSWMDLQELAIHCIPDDNGIEALDKFTKLPEVHKKDDKGRILFRYKV